MFIEERKKYFFFFDQLKYCVDKFVGRNFVLQTCTHIPLLQSKRKVKFSQIKGNGKKFSHIELSNSWIFEQCGKEGLCYFIFPTGFEARQKLDWRQIVVVLYTLFFIFILVVRLKPGIFSICRNHQKNFETFVFENFSTIIALLACA